MNNNKFRQEDISRGIDWVTVVIYFLMVLIGWLNIYAAVYDPSEPQSLFDMNSNAGRQLLWIGTSLVLITAVLTTEFKFFELFAYVIYGVVLLLLVFVLVAGKEVAGSKSWLGVGNFGIQPAEFAKMATALALAKYLNNPLLKLDKLKDQLFAGVIIGIPAVLILLQNDTGSTLVFACFIFVLFREGLPSGYPLLALAVVALFILTLVVDKFYLSIGLTVLLLAFVIFLPRRQKNYIVMGGIWLITLGVVFGVDYFITKVLQPHQQVRIKVLVDPNMDPLGIGWNVTQSKIAIGSGGFWGKGFTEGTQTKFNFVPEQSTDFIFCTIGEEHGFVGSVFVMLLFLTLFLRIVFIAERQKSRFSRIYAYGVLGVIFFHFFINIGMTMGLFPVIGIPLPFFSYGGSSLWSFTVLLFILLKLDAHRTQILERNI